MTFTEILAELRTFETTRFRSEPEKAPDMADKARNRLRSVLALVA